MSHLIIVGCGKSKADTAKPARELYTGSLFRASYRWASAQQARGAVVKIASALHGLVDPELVVEPYEHKLTPKARQAWVGLVREQFRADPFVEVTILAGGEYESGLALAVVGIARSIYRPLNRLQVGQRLQWFKQRAA